MPGQIEPSVKEGISRALGGPWWRDESEQMHHGNGTETPCTDSTVKAEFELLLREDHGGGMLSGGGEASKVRKEGRIPAGGRGRTAHVGKWPELLERIVEERKGEI